MTRLLLSLFGFFVMVGMSIMVMVFGWGLQPVSWGWIVGGGIAGSFIAALFQMADKY